MGNCFSRPAEHGRAVEQGRRRFSSSPSSVRTRASDSKTVETRGKNVEQAKTGASGARAIPEHEGIKNMEQKLSEHHLQCIYEDSYDVRSKWYNVGLTLRLKSSTLDAIKANFDTCEEQYRECLKEWLKQDTHVKSMKVFIAALRDRTVKEESLANQLEMRYCRQNSPQEGCIGSNREREKDLRKRFHDLVDKAKEIVRTQMTVDSFTTFLCRMPVKYKEDHINFLEKRIPQLEEAKEVKTIFNYLELHWSVLSPDLLEYILTELGDEDSIQKFSCLKKEVEEFRNTTTIDVYVEMEDTDLKWKYISDEHPCYILVTNHGHGKLSGDSTIAQVEEFRKDFAHQFTFHKVALCIKKFQHGSVQVFWSIPPSIAPLLLADMQKHPEKLEILDLISATIGSTSVYSPGMTFTPMNVLRAVQKVEDTECLGRYLGVPDSKRNEIMRRFSSIAEQKEAFINYFIKHDPEAMWRSVIRALDWMNEERCADGIRHLAEPITDPTLTIKNLCLVTATVGDWYWLGCYDSGLRVPDCVRQMIKKNLAYKTEEEKKEALLLYYLRNVPSASWQNVAGVLHYMEEVTALEALNGFWKSPPAEPSLTSHNLTIVLDKIRDDLFEELWYFLYIPESKWEKIESEFSSSKEIKQAVIEYIVSSHPAPSWRLVGCALYQSGYDSCHEALIKQQELFSKEPIVPCVNTQSSSSSTAP